MSLFTNDTKVNEPKEFAKARKALLALGSKAPEFSARQIAGMSDVEQTGQDVLSGYVSGQSPEVSSALASLGEASKVTNLMDVPEYAALYNTGRADIAKDANRLGRSLQLSGNTSSSSGADVLMSSIGEANSRLLSNLAPYASQERERRYQAPITAAELATSDTQNRLAAAKTYGALPRELEQLSLDADYMMNYLNATAPYTYQIPALSAVGGIGNTTVSGGGLSDLGMLAQIGGQLGAGFLTGGMGGS